MAVWRQLTQDGSKVRHQSSLCWNAHVHMLHTLFKLKMNEDKQRFYRFGTTWGWVINDRIFIFGWTIPSNIWIDWFKPVTSAAENTGALWQKHVNTSYLIEPIHFFRQNELSCDHFFFSVVTYIKVKQLLEIKKTNVGRDYNFVHWELIASLLFVLLPQSNGSDSFLNVMDCPALTSAHVRKQMRIEGGRSFNVFD